ncbi:MAG TPA: MepB family protein [Daejeonella sp.]|nr:MepB family protein [Daejeonella sp.]
MASESTLTEINSVHPALKIVKDLVYDRAGISLSNLKIGKESVEYGACSFELNGKLIQHRVSKITPMKAGQFVTIWKRSEDGVTEPFDDTDDIDFIIITVRMDSNIGQFILPKSLLIEKGIITSNGKNGKRGIRVYPPWDTVTNKQATKTQSWQRKYFLEVGNDASLDLDWLRQLFR